MSEAKVQNSKELQDALWNDEVTTIIIEKGSYIIPRSEGIISDFDTPDIDDFSTKVREVRIQFCYMCNRKSKYGNFTQVGNALLCDRCKDRYESLKEGEKDV